jgi:hypothetical protein
MTTTVTEVTHSQSTDASAREERTVREDALRDEWQELIRVLDRTDEDELPLFGRMPA